MKYVCVYLGASSGNNPVYKEAVIRLAHEMADLGYTLVYGGSSLGLMGLLAKTMKESGGKVIGIITKHLINKEKPLENLDELHIVESMQERKKMMQKLADVFVTVPGGLGTLEEAIETWNAIKIGEIDKKIGFLNINGFFDHLFSFIDHCKDSGFMTQKYELVPEIESDVKVLLSKLFNKNAIEFKEEDKFILN